MAKTLSQVLTEQRQAQDAREAPAVDRIVGIYERMQRDIEARIVQLDALIADALRTGGPVDPDWLHHQARYRVLLSDIQQITGLYATEGNRAIRDARYAEIIAGRADAVARMGARGPVSTTVFGSNYQATESLLAALHRDSPVHDVLASFGDEYAAIIERELINGVATGQSAANIRRAMWERAGGEIFSEQRLMTIIRTESMRAYKASLVEQYEQVPELEAFEWTCHRSTRTCAACLAMDGQRFATRDEIPGSHPNCRCTISPVPQDEYQSVRDYFRRRGDTDEWLRRQRPATIRKILPSQEAYDAFMAGDVSIKDFAGRQNHPRYGVQVVQRSGRQVLAGRP